MYMELEVPIKGPSEAIWVAHEEKQITTHECIHST